MSGVGNIRVGGSRQARLAVVLMTVLLGACWGMPSNFASLPLDQKIDAYVQHFKHFGRPNARTRALISWHGWAGADAMAQYLNGQRKGLPEVEAIEIIYAVQVRGCSLRGTAAERAVEAALARSRQDPLERLAARGALDVIHRDFKLGGLKSDGIKGGPCDPER